MPLPSAAPQPERRFSLLALGDTGQRHALPALREGQLAVARGLVHEDLRDPVDALLLLGDNFYPRGLLRSELVARIRANLVWPYCRFVDLGAPRGAEVAGACRLAPALRRPVPIHALLGNHDHKSPESAALQREAIPRYVANWHLAEGIVEVRTPAPGLSLVLVDTPRVRTAREAEEARESLARAPGPWRIVAGHEPIAALAEGELPWPSAALLRSALRDAGVPVHLYLSGHSHNLQLLEGSAAAPALHAIAGGGANRRPLERAFRGRRFGARATGFARIDLRRRAGGEALVVSLFETPRYPLRFWEPPRLRARLRVDAAGHIEPEPRATRSPR